MEAIDKCDARGRFVRGSVANPGGRPREVEHVREFARQHIDEAIGTLARLMRDENTPPATRVAAAGELLNRGYGRAPQAVEIANVVDHGLIQMIMGFDAQPRATGQAASLVEDRRGATRGGRKP